MSLLNKKKKTIISFDIGIKNLAICLIEASCVQDFTIIEWETISLTTQVKGTPRITTLINKLVDVLHRFDSRQIDVVLIETQSKRSATLQGISIAIYTFFKSTRGGDHINNKKKSSKKTTNDNINNNTTDNTDIIGDNDENTIITAPQDIRLFSAKNKLNTELAQNLPRAKYQERKKSSVLAVQAYLQRRSEVHNKWITLLNETKKKDDLSDSALQAIYYIENILVQHQAKRNVQKSLQSS